MILGLFIIFVRGCILINKDEDPYRDNVIFILAHILVVLGIINIVLLMV